MVLIIQDKGALVAIQKPELARKPVGIETEMLWKWIRNQAV